MAPIAAILPDTIADRGSTVELEHVESHCIQYGSTYFIMTSTA